MDRMFGEDSEARELRRQLKRTFKIYPECRRMAGRIREVVRMGDVSTWNHQHQAALYAALLKALLRVTSILTTSGRSPSFGQDGNICLATSTLARERPAIDRRRAHCSWPSI